MVKFILLILLLSLAVAIIGCNSPQTTGEKPNGALQSNQLEQNVVDWDKQNLRRLTLSRSQRFGEVNPAVLGAYTQQDELEIFTEAFRTAEQMSGKLDIIKPDYDIIFVTEDAQHSFHLWVDPRVDGGLYTSVSDTGTGYRLTEDAAGKLRQLIDSLPYTSEQAASNGDVVNMHGKITNLDKWVRFLESVKNSKPDEAHITSYTIEGDPIFQDLLYDGQTIEYTYDNTKDAFGSPRKATVFCKSIDQKSVKQGTQYILGQCDREEPAFHFTVEMDND